MVGFGEVWSGKVRCGVVFKKMEEEKIIKFENWRNLFKWDSWRKEAVWLVIILLLIYTFWAYKKDMEVCIYIAENPCEYCFARQEREKHLLDGMNVTFNIPYEFKEVNNLSLNAT